MIPQDIEKKILNAQCLSEVFGIATQNNELEWNEIMACMRLVDPHTFPSSLSQLSDLQILEHMGLDYLYEDCYEQTFLQYIFEFKSCKGSNVFYEVGLGVIEHVANRSDIHKTNALGQNLLFSLVSDPYDYQGEDFLFFISKYNLDINQKDNSDKSLLYHALHKKAKHETINYLLDNCTDVQTDKKGNNALMLISLEKPYDLVAKMMLIFDITQENIYHDCFVDNVFNFYLLEQDSKKQKEALELNLFFLDLITEKRFLIDMDLLSRLSKKLLSYQTQFCEGPGGEEKTYFQNALTACYKFKLDYSLEEKAAQKINKI